MGSAASRSASGNRQVEFPSFFPVSPVLRQASWLCYNASILRSVAFVRHAPRRGGPVNSWRTVRSQDGGAC